jgi:hypothetical protein
MTDNLDRDTIIFIVKFRHILLALSYSVLLIGSHVGNAYMACNVGYPNFLENVGLGVMMVGLVVAIPPGIILWGLDLVGLTWQLRGRESFIESNPWLWVYCTVFYTVAVYLILRLNHRRHCRKKQIQSRVNT